MKMFYIAFYDTKVSPFVFDTPEQAAEYVRRAIGEPEIELVPKHENNVGNIYNVFTLETRQRVGVIRGLTRYEHDIIPDKA